MNLIQIAIAVFCGFALFVAQKKRSVQHTGNSPQTSPSENKETGNPPEASLSKNKEGGNPPQASPSKNKGGGNPPQASPSENKETGNPPEASPSKNKEGGNPPQASPSKNKEGGIPPQASPTVNKGGGIPSQASQTENKGIKLYNIIKGTSSHGLFVPAFQLCRFEYDIIFKALITYASYLSKSNKILYVEASRYNQLMRSYEVKDYHIDSTHTEDIVKKDILQENICESFKVEGREIFKEFVFEIKFYNGNEWWCEVFRGSSYSSMGIDKCSVIEPDLDTLADPEYYSVDDPRDIYMKKLDKNQGWEPCSEEHPDESICKNQSTNTFTKVMYYCHKTKRSLGYKVVNYYNNQELGTYTLPNSENINGNVDSEKICKLFGFKMYSGDKVICTEIFTKEGWICEDFEHRYFHDGYSSYGFSSNNVFRKYPIPEE